LGWRMVGLTHWFVRCRQLALRFHPDKAGDPLRAAAETIFKYVPPLLPTMYLTRWFTDPRPV
jgi:hypothetical protein